MRSALVHVAILALAAATAVPAFAGQEMMDIDSNYRARIAKEKLRMAAAKRESDKLGQNSQSAGQSANAQCGSQSIGTVDTGGRGGRAPREVFVFAPNAINIVGRGGCN